MDKNIVIGIEGMVASGKTSICKELIKMIPNSIFIDAGEIYRGIVEAIRENNIDLNNIKEHSNIDPLELMKKQKVEFKIEDKITQIYIGGKKTSSNEIEKVENPMGVSEIALSTKANSKNLYKFAKKIIDTYRTKFNIILSARDLVTIYPDMTVHVYITASLEERIKRRYNQYNQKYAIEDIREMILKRDKLHEMAGFNKLYEKSIKVDVSDCKNAEESAKKVINNIGGFINEIHK